MKNDASGKLGLLAVVVGIFAAPWLGAAAGHRIPPSLFVLPPPLRVMSGSTGFSWIACGLVAAAICAVAVILIRLWRPMTFPFGTKTAEAESSTTKKADTERNDTKGNPTANASPLEAQRHRSKHHIPWWAWAALIWTAGWWVVAWTRLGIFSSVQRYTFFPLWLGFIIVTNAIARARSGTCLMLRSPLRWLGLFGASAALWWVFEWLNRFVENWHYIGVAELRPGLYALHATLSFSTVLPSVCAVAEIFGGTKFIQRLGPRGPRLDFLERGVSGPVLLTLGYALLIATGLAPHFLYPSLWVAPLLILLGYASLRQRGRALNELSSGDWSRALSWMLAALLCGFFWETWNFFSFAKWFYTVPGVNRWRVFEMPLLGYSGYVPFGLECLLIADLLIKQAQTANQAGVPAKI